MTTPFHNIIGLLTDTPRPVTLPFLDKVRSFMPKDSVPKYQDIFSVLEYLASKNAVVLDFNNQTHYIYNPHYGK